MGKIALFGGSFDPVHKAHIEMAQLALNDFDLKEIIFIAAYKPPHKEKQYALPSQRLQMLNLAIKDIPRMRLSLYEIEKKSVIYSYQTADYFQALYPKDKIFLLIGGDSLKNLPTWKNIDYIISKYRFIVAARAQIEMDKNTKYADRCLFVKQCVQNISSTNIRFLFSQGRNFEALDFLDDKVYAYIKEKKLYV
ncbi:MAG: nicotinate (nicotinamide) nucleotide adenylyltransferase [Elusimicrobiota bacterium]|jgi:nicotinate-nucleotide adenylyltransferase|nr:nicotinate (nicotinamide) nucleotide adenylyltransferase [Elusimicrobiota bacterium]